MRHRLVAIIIGLCLMSLIDMNHMPSVNATDVSSGNVSGAWTRSGSPYLINGDVTVNSGDTLTIEAGVQVYFSQNYSLSVYGRIIAIGTQADNITFAWYQGTSEQGRWKGIYIQSATNPSTLSYCQIANAATAVQIKGSGNTVSRNTIRYNTEGVLLDYAEGNKILDNEIYENTRFGICVQRGSQRNEISRNSIYKIGASLPIVTGHGILFRGGPAINIDNKIIDNKIYNNHLTAIRIDHVQTLTISGNVIYYNWRSGQNATGGNILLAQVTAGYMQYWNRDVTIYNNRIHTALGNGSGIYIQNAADIRITYNDVYLNGYAGITADYNANQVQTHHNDIRNNKTPRSQAVDFGSSNNWDDGSRGNYWSDYNSTDANNDGIGDTPYTLYPLSKNRKDYFPLMHPLLFLVTTVTTSTTATSTIPFYTTTSFKTTFYGSTTISSTTITTNTTTTTFTTTFPTAAYSTVLGTLTSYFITVSTPTTIYVYVTTSTSTSITTTTTSTSTSFTTVLSTVTLTTSETTSVTGRRCVIASAAYGSDLAPAVQFLREFRDARVSETFAGRNFMNVFERFYYSFSPQIADAVSRSQVTMALTRLILVPLVTALQASEAVFQMCSTVREAGAIVSGIMASTLIGIAYAAPMITMSWLKRKKSEKRKGFSLYPLSIVWVGALVVLGVGLFMRSSFLVMTGSGTLVLDTVVLAPLVVLKLLHKLLP